MGVSMMSSQVRAMDRMFERVMGMTGHRNPLMMVDNIFDRLETFTQTACMPEEGSEFTVYKMVPTTYRAEKQEDGSVLLKIVEKKAGFSEELKGPDMEKDADKKV
jgi:hypothetical protein|tara:strand:+ start:485 stop:799 length:315 start_codon:yes stop_codon:yes gene_type:complete